VGGAKAAEPWFHRRPGLTIAVASALYAIVLGLRLLVAAPEPITLLFCFPIALLAVAFGLRAVCWPDWRASSSLRSGHPWAASSSRSGAG
jgi:hypothetical protein